MRQIQIQIGITGHIEGPADQCSGVISDQDGRLVLLADEHGVRYDWFASGPGNIARQLRELHREVSFDVANVEVLWAGLSEELVRDTLRRLMQDAVPLLERLES